MAERWQPALSRNNAGRIPYKHRPLTARRSGRLQGSLGCASGRARVPVEATPRKPNDHPEERQVKGRRKGGVDQVKIYLTIPVDLNPFNSLLPELSFVVRSSTRHIAYRYSLCDLNRKTARSGKWSDI